MPVRDSTELLISLPEEGRRAWLRALAPDDAADLIQSAPAEERSSLLEALDPWLRADVAALLAYKEDEAGGVMSPRFARLRPEMSIDEAIAYLRRQVGQVETIYYAYVLDAEQRLVGTVSFRELLLAGHDQSVRTIMRTNLIISSGGNSGAQATTLVIRAMALGEVRLRHWWKILRREFMAGAVLGTVLCVIGVSRILLWHGVSGAYGEHFARVAVTVGVSLIGVVLLGTLTGAMLPLLLRAFRLDPASASAPAVATVVDVSGLIIYFSVAKIFILGELP
jgi:Mg/Co/Ni transporter MgtE